MMRTYKKEKQTRYSFQETKFLLEVSVKSKPKSARNLKSLQGIGI